MTGESTEELPTHGAGEGAAEKPDARRPPAHAGLLTPNTVETSFALGAISPEAGPSRTRPLMQVLT